MRLTAVAMWHVVAWRIRRRGGRAGGAWGSCSPPSIPPRTEGSLEAPGAEQHRRWRPASRNENWTKAREVGVDRASTLRRTLPPSARRRSNAAASPTVNPPAAAAAAAAAPRRAVTMASFFYSFVDYCRHPAVPYKKVAWLPAACAASPAAAPRHTCSPHTTAYPAQFGEAGDIETSNKRLWAALAAEFLGMMLFALYGGEARDSAAAYGNGLALAVLICEPAGTKPWQVEREG